jgi:hypothetical protein
MAHMRRIGLMAALAALTASLAIAPVGLAGGPTSETEIVSDSFHDDFLSQECGVDVWTTATGMVTRRVFQRDAGVQTLNTVNISLVAHAGENEFRFRDVGADVQQLANGTLTLLIIGQVPFGWTGVLKIDVATDEIVLEPHWVDAARACAALAG